MCRLRKTCAKHLIYNLYVYCICSTYHQNHTKIVSLTNIKTHWICVSILDFDFSVYSTYRITLLILYLYNSVPFSWAIFFFIVSFFYYTRRCSMDYGEHQRRNLCVICSFLIWIKSEQITMVPIWFSFVGIWLPT